MARTDCKNLFGREVCVGNGGVPELGRAVGEGGRPEFGKSREVVKCGGGSVKH